MRESTLWLLHIITGLLLVLFFAVHLAEFSALVGGAGYEEGLTYTLLSERAQNILYTVFYIVFLATVTYHANYGLRVLLIEWLGGRWEKAINILLILLGLAAVLYGSYVTITFHLMSVGV